MAREDWDPGGFSGDLRRSFGSLDGSCKVVLYLDWADPRLDRCNRAHHKKLGVLPWCYEQTVTPSMSLYIGQGIPIPMQKQICWTIITMRTIMITIMIKGKY